MRGMDGVARQPPVAALALALGLLACSTTAEDPATGLAATKAGTTAEAGDPTVDAVDPAVAPQDTTLDVRVLGSNYDRGSTAQLLLDGIPTPQVVTNSTRYRNPGELIANVTIAPDAVLAAYDVLVTTSRGKKGIGIEKFTVTVKNGQPWDCGATPLRIAFRDAVGDALRSDGAGPYVSGTDGSVHLNSATGRLMLWTRQDETPPPRPVLVTTTAFDGSTTDRIFTNGHTSESGTDVGCGFKDIANGATESAVFEAELNVLDRDPYEVLRYGKDCAGNPVPATRVDITRSADGLSWTVTGTTGRHCKALGKKSIVTQIGTAGAFEMTLTALSPP